MSTNEQTVYELLDKLEVQFQRVDHPAIYSVQNVPFDLPGPQVKNLVLKSKKGKQYYLVILPDKKRADLKALAGRLHEKRLSFVSESKLKDLLDVPSGTVTPFALENDVEHKIQVVIDSDIDRNSTVGFHPYINTTTLILQYPDFEKVLNHLGYKPTYILL